MPLACAWYLVPGVRVLVAGVSEFQEMILLLMRTTPHYWCTFKSTSAPGNVLSEMGNIQQYDVIPREPNKRERETPTYLEIIIGGAVPARQYQERVA